MTGKGKIVKTMKLLEPITYYGGVHRDCLQKVFEIRILLDRKEDGFYLMAGAYSSCVNHSLYLHLDDFDKNVYPYKRTIIKTIEMICKDDFIKKCADELIEKTIKRIFEYSVKGEK